jgi:hypothetical protein
MVFPGRRADGDQAFHDVREVGRCRRRAEGIVNIAVERVVYRMTLGDRPLTTRNADYAGGLSVTK